MSADSPPSDEAIYDQWGIPASLSGSLAVVASPSMIRGLGALALGFSLAPLPGYPIQGSPRVENYLTSHLKETFGHAYLPLHPDEEPGAQIMRGLHAMRYVIVGSGPAGISAAEEIRREDPEGPITMITADPHPAASPVMLTYWVSGHFPREGLFFREMESWAGKNRVTLRCGETVAAVDASRQAVTLSAGGEVAYDRLLIATGAAPVIPPIPGIRASGVYPFRTFADAEGILTSRADLKEVCIMGGGFIGIKLACHLRERGLAVAVIEKEPRLASRIFDQRASDIVKEQLRRNGITVETGSGITEITTRDGWVSGVRLEDGRDLPAQILVAAVGVRPNTAFLDQPIAAPRGGIPVDERMAIRRSRRVRGRRCGDGPGFAHRCSPSTMPSGPPPPGRGRWPAPTWPAGAGRTFTTST